MLAMLVEVEMDKSLFASFSSEKEDSFLLFRMPPHTDLQEFH
jgi:hypothetical protein